MSRTPSQPCTHVEELVEGLERRDRVEHLLLRAASNVSPIAHKRSRARRRAMLRLWNLMKGSISRAEAGLSYLAPCFLVSESRRRRTDGHDGSVSRTSEALTT